MSTIHSCWIPLGARSAVRCGTARYRTEKSMVTRKVGKPSRANPTHSRRPANRGLCSVLMVRSLARELLEHGDLDAPRSVQAGVERPPRGASGRGEQSRPRTDQAIRDGLGVLDLE